MSTRFVLACIVLGTLTLLGCGGPEARQDDTPVEKAPPKALTPTEKATQDVQTWHVEVATWQKDHAAPFASEGHETSDSTLTLNALAQEAYGSAGPYPVGAVLSHVGTPSGSPDAAPLTWMMVKMEAGYDTEGNDWYYATLDQKGSVLLAGPGADPAVGEACGGCHRFGAGGTDFVFGVPQEAR